MAKRTTQPRWTPVAIVAVVVAVLTVVPVPGLPTPVAGADPGDATPELTDKQVNVTEAEGGDLVTYTINYTCSNGQGGDPADGCDGAVLTDPLPTFTDVYGSTVPVEFVSAGGGGTIFPGPVTSVIDPDTGLPVLTTTAASWPAGTSGSLVVTVRVPPNTVPPGQQTLANTATVSDCDGIADCPATNPPFTDDSTTAVTTIDGSTPDWTISKLGPGDNLRLDTEYTWTISVCTEDPNSALFPTYDITDTLPEGFQYTSSDPAGTYTDDGNPPADVSDGTATVTWHYDEGNPPPLGDDGCFRMHVTGSFPSSEASNVPDAVKTNTASGDGGGTDMGDDSTTGVIVPPGFYGGTVTKRYTDLDGNDDFFVQSGDEGRFNLGFAVDSDIPLESVVLDDGTFGFDDGVNPPVTGAEGWPDTFLASSLDPGHWDVPLLQATIRTSTDGVVFTDLATVGNDAANVGLPPGTRAVQWVWNPVIGSIPGDFSASGLQIIGTIQGDASDFGRYDNTAAATVVPTDGDAATGTATDSYQLEDPSPDPGIRKDVNPTSRVPGQTATYSIRVDNSADATGDLVEPIVEDCVPEYLDLNGPISAAAPWATLDPSTVVCPNPADTPLRLQWGATLAPGDATTPITVPVMVRDDPDPAPYRSYVNTAFVMSDDGSPFTHCQNTNPSCGDTATVVVNPLVRLDSYKCVSGQLDGGLYRPSSTCNPGEDPSVVSAQTVPGGLIDYRLHLENVGNVDAQNVQFIDLLPREGDTSVISGTPRGSEYTPFLLTTITAPLGWTVEYSTSANPCRPEVGGPASGCDAPGWTSTPDPLALSSYRSIRLSYGDILLRGQSADFGWTMRAQVFNAGYDQGGTDPEDPYEFLADCSPTAAASDPTHCPRAENTFAYGADPYVADLPDGVVLPGRLFAEPPQVEVRVVDPPPANAIGDRVWFDDDFDGIQDPDEDGISNVRVDLVEVSNPQNPIRVSTTFTDADGRYLFSYADILGPELPLEDGTYEVRFYPEPGYYISPPDQTGAPIDVGAPPTGIPPDGPNTDDDSDVSPAALSDAIGTYVATVPIQLGDQENTIGLDGPGETDLTWDLGLWFADPAITVDKVTGDTRWADGAYGDGVLIVPGSDVEWIYTVTNSGNTRLEDVAITDDSGTPSDSSDDVAIDAGDCTIVEPGTNASGASTTLGPPIDLNRGAVLECRVTSPTPSSSTAYDNVVTVTGHPVTDDGDDLDDRPDGSAVPDTVTDADASGYDPATYDLALAKTVSAPDLINGTATFTITVQNQGSLPSGPYSIADELTAGLDVTATSPVATSSGGSSAAGETLGWTDLPSLAPGATQVLTIDVDILDYTQRPFRNLAEITDDSADQVMTGDDLTTPATDPVLTPTTDIDSTPDTDIANDGDYGRVGEPSAIDNASIADAGNGADAPPVTAGGGGEDDADIADLVPNIQYDLALAKVGDASPVGLGVNPSFTIRVYNQGNVPSGAYAVRDQLPTGLSFDDPGNTDCASAAGNQVVCTGTDLQPGESATFTIGTTIDGTPDDYATAPWQNWAEIDSDSAQDLYLADDIDSVPEATQQNGVGLDDAAPPGEDVIDVTAAGATYTGATTGDEDDNDTAIVETSVVYDLALIKTAQGKGPTQTGDGLIQYTITVANQGTVPSGAYSVTDQVPPGLTVDESTISAGGTLSGSTITWTVGAADSLDAGDTTMFTYVVAATDLTQRPYRNIAEISGDSALALYGLADVDSTPDTDTTNDGDYGPILDSPIDNLVIGDAGTGADAPPVTAAGGGEDDADIADITGPLIYDLALAKTADAEVVGLDDTITYTVTVENQGILASHELTVQDRVPDGLAVDEGSISDGGTLDGGVITWTIDNLDPADSLPLTFQATIDDVTLRPFRNQAEITADSADFWSVPDDTITDVDSTPDDDPANDGDYGPVGDPSAIDNTGADAIDQAGEGADAPPVTADGGGEDDADIADVDVDVRYDLALTKTGPTTMDPLDDVTFDVEVQNQGNVPSNAYEITDDAPDGMVITAASDSGAIAPDGSTVTWSVPDGDSLDPVETRTFTVTMHVEPIPGGLTLRPFTNAAEITADSADDYSTAAIDVSDVDSVPGDDATSAADTTDISEAGSDDVNGADDTGFDDEDIAVVSPDIVYDLALAKTVDQAEIPFDGTATFTVTVENQGNVPSGLYTVTDDVPPGLSAASVSDGGVVSSDGTTVTWTGLPSLDPGATADLTFDVTISDITQRPFVNFAEITADSADDYAVDGDPVVDVDSVPGDEATSAADNTDIGQAGDGDDEGFDDEDIAVLDSPVTYDLALIKTVDQSTIAFDGTATFTISVRNQGNVPSGRVRVTDLVPEGLAAENISDGGTLLPLPGGDRIVWSIEDLQPDETVERTFDVTINDLTSRPWLNSAEITADSADDYSTDTETVTDVDSVPGDEATSDVDNTTFLGAGRLDDEGFDDEDVAPLDTEVVYDLAIDKTLRPGQSYVVGDPVVYDVAVTDEGNVPSGVYSFTDAIPPGMAFVSASDGGTADGQVVTWTDRPSLDPGESATVQVTATITDATLDEYQNCTEVTADSAASFSAEDDLVTDIDSTPANGDQRGEDDDDCAAIPPSEVQAANAEDLPRTGQDPAGPVRTGLALMAAGALAVTVSRRRRRRA